MGVATKHLQLEHAVTGQLVAVDEEQILVVLRINVGNTATVDQDLDLGRGQLLLRRRRGHGLFLTGREQESGQEPERASGAVSFHGSSRHKRVPTELSATIELRSMHWACQLCRAATPTRSDARPSPSDSRVVKLHGKALLRDSAFGAWFPAIGLRRFCSGRRLRRRGRSCVGWLKLRRRVERERRGQRRWGQRRWGAEWRERRRWRRR